ncbi:bifunctional ornithine acetyltransferase/N-acetylglutamate synthase [Helicobacter didelphidarum]|uniref:Arginine biosynthesis bifunctional protein ArgJ n=1 Tax=Helicobacter didelphidarum TaxID=2040648 RepID=A0A3D8IMS1_9HELI|nr:bifunctional ornithine acetyltransferase/N-acetylglutamate synthase [Helicobacter didelphidarum]RDU66549.1 bifunctional ornithine acetyltransferase/N-acetylglutamate synthase [Helicobacter didelphidarum]
MADLEEKEQSKVKCNQIASKKVKIRKTSKLPRGFKLSGIKANIKYKNRFDLALIYSKVPATGAGVWTKNSMQAACILYNKATIKNKIHAVMINSGYANACTSIQGDKNCILCAKSLGDGLLVPSESILLASTGVIGEQLPMERILKGIPKLIHNRNNAKDSIKQASKAIMTTDTYPKTYGVKFWLESADILENLSNNKNPKPQDTKNENITTKTHKDSLQENTRDDTESSKDSQKEKVVKSKKDSQKINARIWGMAKGSGMIHPNMATMLGFILTDVAITQNLLQEALSEIVQQSFNQISVDGDTSTNDMVIILANGKAGNKEITQKNKDYETFRDSLKLVCVNLAKKIARDGEGATHLLEVVVKNAKTLEQAQRLSKAVIGSNLVKTAIFGKDANWGRIICAMGYSEAEFDSKKLDLYFESKKGKIKIVHDGIGLKFNENKARTILGADKVRIVINLNDGIQNAKAWGCDLSYGYIKINADYRS